MGGGAFLLLGDPNEGLATSALGLESGAVELQGSGLTTDKGKLREFLVRGTLVDQTADVKDQRHLHLFRRDTGQTASLQSESFRGHVLVTRDDNLDREFARASLKHRRLDPHEGPSVDRNTRRHPLAQIQPEEVPG